MRGCAIRSLILLPGATLWVAGCSPQAAPQAQAAHRAQGTEQVVPTEQARATEQPPRSEQAPATQQPQPSRLAQPYRLTATIQDLMNGMIDPSADVLWDSVAYIATTKGIEDRRPRTDAQWKTVRDSAITLIEAASLLSMPGRRVAAAHEGTGPSPGGGELGHAEIQQRIDSTRDSFTQLARNLRDSGQKALAAIEAKDAERLMDAGGTIDQACEACHIAYWYPHQNHPGS